MLILFTQDSTICLFIKVIFQYTLISALQKKRSDTNTEACDMWSFAIVLWELATRQIPFFRLSPMEIGMKV